MPKVLTESQVEHFRREGFLTPVAIMPPSDARAVLDQVGEWEKDANGTLHAGAGAGASTSVAT